MDYLIGSLTTLLIIFAIIRFLSNIKPSKPLKQNKFRYSQSSIHEMIKPLIPQELLKRTVISQSSKHEEKYNIKVIILENTAYWIKDNRFYMADIEDGIVDKDSTRIVDTMAMDPVELDKMLFIMDKLREGFTNDSGSAGN